MKNDDLVTYICPKCKRSRVSKWRSGRPYEGERLCRGCGISATKRSDDWTRTHDSSRTPLYRVWCAMLQRCDNPNNDSYPRYGGRGIAVCSAWYAFPAFKKWAETHGYAIGLYLDRKDNNGSYSPRNCKWATSSESGKNRSNVKLNENLVLEIRLRLVAGERPIDIAKTYDIDPRSVSGIKHGHKWGWVQ